MVLLHMPFPQLFMNKSEIFLMTSDLHTLSFPGQCIEFVFDGAQAAYALANLAKTTDEGILEALHPVIKQLIVLVEEATEMYREQIIRTLANLAKNPESQGIVVSGGAVPLFIDLLSDPAPVCKEQAANALANLSTDEEAANTISKEGGVRPLVELLDNGSRACVDQVVPHTVHLCMIFTLYSSSQVTNWQCYSKCAYGSNIEHTVS